MLITDELIKDFHSRYTIEGDCWLWLKHKTTSRYGGFRNLRANRASYIIHNGPIPDGMYVCHTCDIPHCVNPSHLFLGTQFDNMRDMVAKGRNVNLKGEAHGRAKVTEDDVRDIREKCAAGGLPRRSWLKYTASHNGWYHT